MESEAPTVTCSPQELLFLAGLMGANMLIGIQDPFWGWLAEEVEEAWKGARQALSDRRFIAVKADGGIVMDVGVAAMVATCAFPEASFVVSQARPDARPVLRHLHVTRYLAVEQAASDAGCHLTALRDVGAAHGRIVEILGVGDQPAVAAPGGRLREERLAQARALAVEAGPAAAQAALEAAGLQAATAAALSETLSRPLANGALAALAHREAAWEVAGLGLLEGCSGLWRLRAFSQAGEPWVELMPCTGQAAAQAVREVMDRVLPAALSLGG